MPKSTEDSTTRSAGSEAPGTTSSSFTGDRAARTHRALRAAGHRTEEIAWQLRCSSRHVRKWKSRFAEDPQGVALEDRGRTGRPARIPVVIRCKLVQLACKRPENQKITVPFRDVWTNASLADRVEGFIKHWNREERHPFRWKWRTDKLKNRE